MHMWIFPVHHHPSPTKTTTKKRIKTTITTEYRYSTNRPSLSSHIFLLGLTLTCLSIEMCVQWWMVNIRMEGEHTQQQIIIIPSWCELCIGTGSVLSLLLTITNQLGLNIFYFVLLLLLLLFSVLNTRANLSIVNGNDVNSIKWWRPAEWERRSEAKRYRAITIFSILV